MAQADLEALFLSPKAIDIFTAVAESRAKGVLKTEAETVEEAIRRLLGESMAEIDASVRETLVPRVAAALMAEPILADRMRGLLGLSGAP